ncbi:hypothetical protein FJZ36_18505 [Candidatus Poribacteria bacterium]|nr:hypothetical protein [Candidatus Poribacteria bacterium]
MLLPQGALVRELQFYANGSRLATADTYATVRTWEIPTGAPLASFTVPYIGLLALDIAEDDRTAVIDGSFGIGVRDLNTGDQLQWSQGHTSWVYSGALSSDRRLLATGSEDSTIRLWYRVGVEPQDTDAPLFDDVE